MEVDCKEASREVFQRFCPAKVMCKVHTQQPRFRYIQPPPPQSYKPQAKYVESEHPLEAESIYVRSYQSYGVDTARDCRPPPVAVHSNITLPSETFESDTVTGLSYQWSYQKPPLPVKPQIRTLMGSGPMQDVTTHRHDYTPKPGERPHLIIPITNIRCSDAKMEDSTITMRSYVPVSQVEPTRSFKPEFKYQVPQCPFESKTTQQLSYAASELPQREMYPWMKKQDYQQPEHRMNGTTVYNGSYLAPGTFELSENVPSSDGESSCRCFCMATDDL